VLLVEFFFNIHIFMESLACNQLVKLTSNQRNAGNRDYMT